MSTLSTPLLFRPVYKDYIWGTETWQIAAHPDGDSEVIHLPPPAPTPEGGTLSSLAARFGAALTGTRAPDPTRFPLLFKIIDARQRLSVQVHPSNATAALTNGEPKTEMWYVLGAGRATASPPSRQDSTLYAGLREGVTPDTLRAALANGTAEQCLVKIPAEPGQSLFIPGGLVHAIGEGCLIYEVQQNSNTTYRLYDWNRTDAHGKPRPLHIEESFKVIDWTSQPPRMTAPAVTRTTLGATWADVLSCDYFNIRKLTLSAQEFIPVDGTSFHALFIERGSAIIEAGGTAHTLTAGMSCLIPAAAKHYALSPLADHATLLLTTL